MTTIMSQPIQQPIDYKTPPAPEANYVADVSPYSYESYGYGSRKER